jgi:hypothetical protein
MKEYIYFPLFLFVICYFRILYDILFINDLGTYILLYLSYILIFYLDDSKDSHKDCW